MRTRLIGLLALVLALLGGPSISEAARQTNGTNQELHSASALSYGSATKVAVSVWVWVDAFTNANQVLMESGDSTFSASDVQFVVNADSSATSKWSQSEAGDAAANSAQFTRPSAAAWHHYAFDIDIGQAVNEIVDAYIDGSSQSLTRAATNNNTVGLTDNILHVMSRTDSTLWLAGRVASLAIWTGGNFSGANVTSLNGGTPPTSVSVAGGTLLYYWTLCGNNSPELPTTGAINMTVTGATQVAHPSAIAGECTAVTPVLQQNSGFLGVLLP